MRTARRIGRVVLLAMTLAFSFCVGVVLTVYVSGSRAIYPSVDAVPPAPVALLLGASIRSNGTLSAVLAERADTAYALYEAKKVSKILVSGDNSTLQYDEVYPVGKYLLAKGVPKDDIFLDYAGFDTYSSLYRAKSVFAVSNVVVVSQRFHLPRALFIARSLGIAAVGVDAGQAGEQYVPNTVREVPASLKAVFDVFSGRVPKYTGPDFPITGSGEATWVGPKVEKIYFKPVSQ